MTPSEQEVEELAVKILRYNNTIPREANWHMQLEKWLLQDGYRKSQPLDEEKVYKSIIYFKNSEQLFINPNDCKKEARYIIQAHKEGRLEK